MTSLATDEEVVCSNCGTSISAALRFCTACQNDAGVPNVRACGSTKNRKALKKRFDAAKELASVNECSTEFSRFSSLVESESGVVVSMPPGVARSLLEDPSYIYQNYERLVGNNIRRPARAEDDRCRFSVSSLLFGAYADKIIYGVLSLTTEGLPTYGDIHFRLREVTVAKRTSFLETNSYKFVETHGVNPSVKIPAGYRASWSDRHMLVLAKLADRLSEGQCKDSWQQILIESDGKDRGADEFLEAHIYEGFDRNAIESMEDSSDEDLSRGARIDRDVAIAEFKKFSGNTK